MIKNKGWELLFIRMVVNILGSGKMINMMEKAHFIIKKVNKLKENGVKGN